MQFYNKFVIKIPKLVGYKRDKERIYLYLQKIGMRKMKG